MTTILTTIALGVLALSAIARTIVEVARDGYRRTPPRTLVRWYQRDDALRSPARAPR
jgi:hypothetical protein